MVMDLDVRDFEKDHKEFQTHICMCIYMCVYEYTVCF